MTQQDRTALNSAMKTTLWVAFVLFAIKFSAYWFSGSAAVLGDATASIVQLAAAIFASYSFYYSEKNPSDSWSKVNFLSGGFEGSMIILAGLFTVFISLYKWLTHSAIEALETATVLMGLAALIKAGLGFYLIRLGKAEHSLMVESSGRRTLSDSGFSLAVVAGLLLYSFSGRLWIDPLCGVILSLCVIYSGYHLAQRSFESIADKADPVITRQLTELLSQRCAQYGISFHQLHHSNDGERHNVSLHLLFSSKTEIGEAHRIAGEIEVTLISALSNRAHIVTHLESQS